MTGAARDADRPKVEIGWLLEGDLGAEGQVAATRAATAMERALAEAMPMFAWHVETVERPAEPGSGPLEPVRLVDTAETERDAHGWDFTFVVTRQELRGRQQSQVMGMTSGIFATALMSTAFLAASEPEVLTRRLHALAMHLFGRLNGLAPDRSDTLTGTVETPDDLDRKQGFDGAAVTALKARIEAVADLRVEEMHGPRQGKLRFYARSIWLNRGALPGAIAQMRPWSFPLRLSRLTTAAGSALVVLVMTAEAWEVAANLSIPLIVCLSALSLAATSAYLLRAQRLLAHRRGPLREQRAVSNAATVCAVALGMAVTYLGVFAVAWLMARALFGDALLSGWISGSTIEAGWIRPRMAAFAASLSVVIGALGASFESYGYFRHVTQIDDEI